MTREFAQRAARQAALLGFLEVTVIYQNFDYGLRLKRKPGRGQHRSDPFYVFSSEDWKEEVEGVPGMLEELQNYDFWYEEEE